MFISVCLCPPHAYTQKHRESICAAQLAFLYFTSRLFTPLCPHSERGSTTTPSDRWCFEKSVFVAQQRCECALKISICAVMCVHVCLCVCVHLTLHSVVSLQRKEHKNWSKLDLAGCKGAVLWTCSHWDSMEYSVYFCLCYAQLFLLFWALKKKKHNAKVELFGVYMHCGSLLGHYFSFFPSFFSSSCSIEKWLHHM